MKLLCKIDRLMAWVLLFGMTLFFISGYGMTKGVIDSAKSANLHNKYLPIIITVAFVFHAGYATRLALMRWKWWKWPIKALWLIFFAGFLGSFIYIDQWYEKGQTENNISANTAQTGNDSENQSEATNQQNNDSQIAENNQTFDGEELSTVKSFSAEELSKYDGKNGNPAYVAVDGKVYDLTSVFEEGKHYSHYAGKELTKAFYSYHLTKALAKYPVVGLLKE